MTLTKPHDLSLIARLTRGRREPFLISSDIHTWIPTVPHYPTINVVKKEYGRSLDEGRQALWGFCIKSLFYLFMIFFFFKKKPTLKYYIDSICCQIEQCACDITSKQTRKQQQQNNLNLLSVQSRDGYPRQRGAFLLMSVSMDSYLSIKSFQPSCMSTIPERRNQEGESVFDLQFGKLSVTP